MRQTQCDDNAQSRFKLESGSKTFANDTEYSAADIDVDLTSMGSEMVYATVYDVVSHPENYMGQVVRARGPFAHSRDETLDADYYFVVIQDATACCAQGLEFVWGNGSKSYPEGYPQDGEDIVVTGELETYEERSSTYVHIANANVTMA